MSIKDSADTVMGLFSGGKIPKIRQDIIETSAVPIGTVPIYEVESRVGGPEEMSGNLFLEVIVER